MPEMLRQRLKPAEPQKPVIERAFELARTGEFAVLKTLERALWAEGYSRCSTHLSSPSLRRQLRTICRETNKADL